MTNVLAGHDFHRTHARPSRFHVFHTKPHVFFTRGVDRTVRRTCFVSIVSVSPMLSSSSLHHVCFDSRVAVAVVATDRFGGCTAALYFFFHFVLCFVSIPFSSAGLVRIPRGSVSFVDRFVSSPSSPPRCDGCVCAPSFSC